MFLSFLPKQSATTSNIPGPPLLRDYRVKNNFFRPRRFIAFEREKQRMWIGRQRNRHRQNERSVDIEAKYSLCNKRNH